MKTGSVASSLPNGKLRSARVSQSDLRRFFAAIGSRLENVDASSEDRPHCSKSKVERFFSTIKARVEKAERQQRSIDQRLATAFNVFHLIKPDENKLSDILANLLDPDGTHGQGDLFLRLLFERLRLGSSASLTKHATVQREAPTHGILKYRRRMDVFVAAGALLVIENKLDALEQRDQVKDYLAHLDTCPGGRKSRLIYLTLDGRQPESLVPAAIEREEILGRLYCWSYQGELRDWLENCRRGCKAERIRDFVSDFMAYIEAVLKREPLIASTEEMDED